MTDIDETGRAEGEAFLHMPGHLLRRCNQIGVAIFLQECRDHDLTPLQYAVLDALARGGAMDQASLGGTAALDRTTTAVVVKNLETRGLVRRQASTEDRRAKIVSVTEAGRRLRDRATGAVARVQERIVAPLTRRERETLVRLLEKMADANNALSRAPQKVE